MTNRTLKLDIHEGTWMVNVIDRVNDDGVYELLHPNKEAQVEVNDEKMQGFEYNITAHAGTPFKLLLDDTVLAEGEVPDDGVARGKGVL
ncbi:hypothetical protein [Salinimonas iocasae]|uniref:Uncharacterized protein n=1 Tax=Salinimonas iocasae TaxID=2572577 RepID=A0A5B7YBX5_9ALTE|nr:hypothetical protein [Salinimonas iocasae]QCZ92716.1 hypothetical protein FBQ74_04150 [Salinimonas iocasae]